MAEREVVYAQSDKNNFKRYFYKYLRRWYLFLISLVLCLAIATAYLAWATPRYLISSSLLIRDIDKGPDFQSGNPVFRDLDVFNAATSIENEIEALKSVTLLERVLTELSLQATYYVDGFLKKREIYGSELPIRLRVGQLKNFVGPKKITINVRDATSFEMTDGTARPALYRFGQPIAKPYGTFVVEPNQVAAGTPRKKVYVTLQNIQDLTAGYHKGLTVAQINKKANVLVVSLMHPVPEKGKAILNTLIEVYNKENKEDRNLLATNTISFIDERLGNLISELSDTEKEVEQFKRRNQVTDVRSEASAYLQESTNYNQQLSQLNIQLDVIRSLQRYLSQPRSQFELVPSTLRIDDRSLQELVARFNELQLQRKRMLRVAEPANPLILNMNGQLATLRQNILENLRTIGAGLEATRGTLAARANTFKSRITQIPNIERELNAINRQAGVKRDLYVYLLQKREESALSLAATVSNTRVIDPAIASKTPVNPNKPVVYGLAFVLALVLPFGFIFLRSFLSDTVQQQEDVAKATTVPVLGEVSHYPSKGTLAMADTSQPLIAEQYRLIRSNFDFATAGKSNQVILVTSGIRAEGKTFVSLNLGISLSLTGKRVVLVDLNLRQPAVLAALGLQEGAGITTLLSEPTVEVDDLIRESTVAPNLSVIGTGPVPQNPAEFLMHPRIATFLGELMRRFDYVIIDSAPVGQVADAFSLASYIDVTVFVVRYNYTPKARIDVINDIATHGKLPQALMVLNDARTENSSSLK
ncbi:capsular exopolysaccharide family [Hymenobacter roseosalivarius DSM 11622]|uniref:Capsular exopolysaccharide family n=1 Tax=Hymenobacter roseosalivarius DSM 11622 TaxID=645990 RepID=A0A1W1W4R3_9BACT|nr:polysaccharide biosynthesis tyrosine autokinase [Hymenobacter roseosalivarius]SMC00618.1 capsular exopolysaccharide family [Hymenobacter roseosalivarius DSM 11622]